MCVPIVVADEDPNSGTVTLTKRAQMAASKIAGGIVNPVAAGTEAAGVNPAPATPADGVPGKTGTVIEPAGGETGGLTPAQVLDQQTQLQTTAAQDQNTLLINSLTEMAHKFTDTTTGVIDAQTNATNALKDGFLSLSDQQQKALDAADQLRKNTGQASRKPNYSLSLAANRKSNSSGTSSTMLTGVTGVPTSALALGRAQLLGGEPA